MSLPAPGSPGFSALLFRHVLDHPALKDWAVNPSLFSTILLTLIAKNGGLVIDIDDYKSDKIVGVVRAMMESIFGLSVGHLSLSSSTYTEELPWKLFRSSSACISQFSTHAPESTKSPKHDLYSNMENKRDIYHHLDKDRIIIPQVLVLTGLESTASTVQMKLCEYLTKKRIEIHAGQGNGTLEDEVVKLCDFNPIVIWIRRNGADVPWWVIDHFMCVTSIQSSEISLPPSNIDLGAIIPQSYLVTLSLLLPYTHIHPPLAIHISNLFSAITCHPSLHSAITQRAVRAFPEYVRAHRLLVGDFALPDGFEIRLQEEQDGRARAMKDRRGTGGGVGGVHTWNVLAGEEPDINDLGGDCGRGEEELEDWYATPSNVQGVWKVCMTHRVRKRQDREQIMWLMKGSASGGMKKSRGRGVGKILDEILTTV
ncbi:hypothetical protein C365_01132 [Cryptococcus neoformans Bt85]|nr:hypothetical protein C365_01132 [Cryptococcus neoformans var. grubii Bt85]OXM81204.1 hypothetical protein C364_01067 [Cryptococcus neoformans var. grubii Bt63]